MEKVNEGQVSEYDESQVSECPIAERIWDSVQTFESHQTQCPFCENPKLVEMLIFFIRRDVPFDEMSTRFQIPIKTIKAHIEEVLNITALEIASNIALMKIITKIDDPEVLNTVKATDVIRAIQSLTSLTAMKKVTKGFNKTTEKLGRISSLDLIKRTTSEEVVRIAS